jgi:hypothetical protein
MMAYRSSVHETTGVTPCRMMFGHEINLRRSRIGESFSRPEALKSLYRSPGYKKNQLALCKNYVLQW